MNEEGCEYNGHKWEIMTTKKIRDSKLYSASMECCECGENYTEYLPYKKYEQIINVHKNNIEKIIEDLRELLK